MSEIHVCGELTDEIRNFLHACLDEFLDHYDAPKALFSLGDFIV